MRTTDAFVAVELEMLRARDKRDIGDIPYVASDPDCPDMMRLAALVEEVGEVARALHDGNPDELAHELVQLAGVACAWRTALP